MKGKFITLEGSDGCGKTTNLNFIRDFLISRGIDVVVTHEPGGTPLAESIRDLILAIREEPVAVDTELLLYFASRAQHLAQVIKPAIEEGRWVLCSRFTDSTYAYQCGGRGIAYEKIEGLEKWVHGDFQPDITFLLDLPVEIGLARTKKRGALDRFELEKVDFFQKVRDVYLKRAAMFDRYKVIDASLDLSSVQKQIKEVLDALITDVARL